MRRTWGLAACALMLAACAATVSRAADDANANGAAAAPATTAAPTANDATAPSLDGIWLFDAKRSDDPRKIMEANRPQGGPGGDGGRRFGGGGMGGGPPGGGPPGGGGGGGFGGRRGGGDGEVGEGGGGDEARGESADGQQRPRVNPFERVLRPAQKVVIEMLEDQVNVSEDERTPRAYAIADSLKAHNHELITDGTKALWKGGRLQMTQTTGRRGAIVESYELSADGRTLTIKAHREGGPEGMPNPTFTRIYTRYEGD